MSSPAKAAASSAPRRAAPLWPWFAAAAAFVALVLLFPPFHLVSKSAQTTASRAATAQTFEPAAFAEKFWTEKLRPAAARAPDSALLLPALRRDYSRALKEHSRRVGLGGVSYFFMRGSGRVSAVERNRLLVDADGTTIAIRTGPVFDNTVRDGSGLIEVNDVPGLTEFNALSAQLNHLVETRVQPALKTAAVGATIEFAGCAEAPEALPAGGPALTLIPVQAEVKP